MDTAVAVEVRPFVALDVERAQYRPSFNRVLKDSGGRDIFAAAAILVNDLVRPANTDADPIHSGKPLS